MTVSLGFGNPENLKKVKQRYPPRLTRHLQRLIKLDPEGPIARQFLPDGRELMGEGLVVPWSSIPSFETPEGMERKYLGRIAVTLTTNCAAYCRYCFRKERTIRKKKDMSKLQIDGAVDYVRMDSRIRDVLLTGGDPLEVPHLLEYSMNAFRKIEHVGALRVGTRIPIVEPEKVTDGIVHILVKNIRPEKPVEIGIHTNHPAELTKETKEVIAKLRGGGLFLYSQTVLLKGINDNAETLLELFSTLRDNGVQPLYLFHCMPIKGGNHFRTKIEKDMVIMDRVNAETGRFRPHYTILTELGKVPGTRDCIMKTEGNIVTLRTQYNVDGTPGCSEVEYMDGG
ncbi:MAG: radical SAM protein [Candidatus Micrarchaeota archaeon]